MMDDLFLTCVRRCSVKKMYFFACREKCETSVLQLAELCDDFTEKTRRKMLCGSKAIAVLRKNALFEAAKLKLDHLQQHLANLNRYLPVFLAVYS